MKKTILVVDDDSDILEAIQFTLEDAGYNVVVTEKGEYAETLVSRQDHLPDLIILDVLLSGRDGREICSKLKNDNKIKNIPIIMISAHPNADISTKEVGANDFLAKPFNVADLLGKIAALLEFPPSVPAKIAPGMHP